MWWIIGFYVIPLIVSYIGARKLLINLKEKPKYGDLFSIITPIINIILAIYFLTEFFKFIVSKNSKILNFIFFIK